MSWKPTPEPASDKDVATNVLTRVITPKRVDLGGFCVRRALPSPDHRNVGPFVFFDHAGPAEFAPGEGIDVRPHPHIGLATVTYLYEGSFLHRDSLGSEQAIEPGAVNWMTAGRGIVHSERTPPKLRESGSPLHGLQIWVALPKERERTEPSFEHHPAETLPETSEDGVCLKVLAGEAFGLKSPIPALSRLFYVDAQLETGASLEVPAGYEERAAYTAIGDVTCDTCTFERGNMLIFAPNRKVTLRANKPSRVALIGGEALDGTRHVWWNLVSSSRERIEQTKADWKEGRFPKVPGDTDEYIPLPE